MSQPRIDPATGQASRNLARHVSEIRAEIRSLCSLYFQDAELSYLRTWRFIKSDFVDFLGLFRLNEKYITEDASTTKAEARHIARGMMKRPSAGNE